MGMIMMKMTHKGDIKRQRQRRRQRSKSLPVRLDNEVELIDGNYTHYPVAYCGIHRAYLSQGLRDTHRCLQRHCKGYRICREHIIDVTGEVTNAEGGDANEPNCENESKLQGSR